MSDLENLTPAQRLQARRIDPNQLLAVMVGSPSTTKQAEDVTDIGKLSHTDHNQDALSGC